MGIVWPAVCALLACWCSCVRYSLVCSAWREASGEKKGGKERRSGSPTMRAPACACLTFHCPAPQPCVHVWPR